MLSAAKVSFRKVRVSERGGGVAQFRFYAKAFTFLFKAKQMCVPAGIQALPSKKQMDASGRQNLLSKEKLWSKTVA